MWKDKVYEQLIREFSLPFTWEDLLADYKRSFPAHAAAFPGTIPMLKKLTEQGYKLGLITNGYTDFQSSNIDALGFRDYFDVILISEAEGLRKPDREIFMRAARMLQTDPEECVYIGDHPESDVEASQSAGMIGIWKEDKGYNEPSQAYGVIRKWSDLTVILEGLRWRGRNEWYEEGNRGRDDVRQ